MYRCSIKPANQQTCLCCAEPGCLLIWSSLKDSFEDSKSLSVCTLIKESLPLTQLATGLVLVQCELAMHAPSLRILVAG